MKTLTTGVLQASLAALVLCAVAEGAFAQRGLERWADDHADAAKDLHKWVKDYPDAARAFFRWDGRNHEQALEFVTWSNQHKDADIGDFAAKHKDCPVFVALLKSDKEAANKFMVWSRKHTRAAKDLMDHDRGLRWAGENIFGFKDLLKD